MKSLHLLGFSNYAITKERKIWNIKRRQFLKCTKSYDGYICVCLSGNTKIKMFRIHRLVAFAFIPVPERLKHIPVKTLQINHIDSNRQNNHTSNLEWCTHLENQQHSWMNGRENKTPNIIKLRGY